MNIEKQSETTLNPLIVVENPIKSKTGFEASLEGEQTWPPRSFKVTPLVRQTNNPTDNIMIVEDTSTMML